MASCTFPRETFPIVDGEDADHQYPVSQSGISVLNTVIMNVERLNDAHHLMWITILYKPGLLIYRAMTASLLFS